MINFSIQKQQSKANAENLRMEEASKALDYYNNRQLDYLLDRIAYLYPTEKDAMAKYAYCYPLTRSLIEDIAICFQETAEILPESETEAVLERWQEVIEKAHLQASLLLTDRMVELLGKVGVCVRWHSSGYVVLDLLTPDRTVVEQDPEDHSKAKSVRYLISEKSNTIDGEICTWAYWDSDSYQEQIINSTGGVREITKNEPNPYGKIPVAWFTNTLELDEFWHDLGYPIVDTNEAVNLRLSNLMLALDYQTVSLLVTVGMPASQSIPVGVTQRLNIPADGLGGSLQGYDAKYITPSPLLRDVWDLINQLITNVARLYGLSAQSYNRDSSSFASGYQLKLSKQDIVNRNKMKRELYREPVKELAGLIAECYSINNSDNFTFGDVSFSVDFGDVKFEDNPMEREQLNAMKLSNGTTSEVQILMDENPDLSREDAIILYEQFREDRNRLGTASASRLANAIGLNEQL